MTINRPMATMKYQREKRVRGVICLDGRRVGWAVKASFNCSHQDGVWAERSSRRRCLSSVRKRSLLGCCSIWTLLRLDVIASPRQALRSPERALQVRADHPGPSHDGLASHNGATTPKACSAG